MRRHLTAIQPIPCRSLDTPSRSPTSCQSEWSSIQSSSCSNIWNTQRNPTYPNVMYSDSTSTLVNPFWDWTRRKTESQWKPWELEDTVARALIWSSRPFFPDTSSLEASGSGPHTALNVHMTWQIVLGVLLWQHKLWGCCHPFDHLSSIARFSRKWRTACKAWFLDSQATKLAIWREDSWGQVVINDIICVGISCDHALSILRNVCMYIYYTYQIQYIYIYIFIYACLYKFMIVYDIVWVLGIFDFVTH